MIRRLSLMAGWLTLAFIAFATLSPIAERPVVAGPQLEHFVAFAAMGCAFAMGYPKRTLIFIVLVIASAFGLEALQLLTADRHGRVIDAVVKAAGGICGVGVGRLPSCCWSDRLSEYTRGSDGSGRQLTSCSYRPQSIACRGNR